MPYSPRYILLPHEPLPYSASAPDASDPAAPWPVAEEMRPNWDITTLEAVKYTEEDARIFDGSVADYAQKEQEQSQDELNEILASIKEGRVSQVLDMFPSQESFRTSPLLTHKSTRQKTTPAKRVIVDLIAQAANGSTPEIARYTYYSPPPGVLISPSPVREPASPLVLIDRQGLVVNESEEDIPVLQFDIVEDKNDSTSAPYTPSAAQDILEPVVAKTNLKPSGANTIPRRSGALTIRDMLSFYGSPSPDTTAERRSSATSPSLTRPPLQLEPTEVDILPVEDPPATPALRACPPSPSPGPGPREPEEEALAVRRTPPSETSSGQGTPGDAATAATGIGAFQHVNESPIQGNAGLDVLALVAEQARDSESFPIPQAEESAAKSTAIELSPVRRSSRLAAGQSSTVISQAPEVPAPSGSVERKSKRAAPAMHEPSSPELDKRFTAEHLSSKSRAPTPEVQHQSSDAIDSESSNDTPVKRSLRSSKDSSEKAIKKEILDEALDKEAAQEPAEQLKKQASRSKRRGIIPEPSHNPIETVGTRSWTKQAQQAQQENRHAQAAAHPDFRRSRGFVAPQPLAKKPANASVSAVPPETGETVKEKVTRASTSSKRKIQYIEDDADGGSDYHPSESENKRSKQSDSQTNGQRRQGLVGVNQFGQFIRYSDQEMEICRRIMKGKKNSKELREECQQALLKAGFHFRSIDALKFKHKEVNV